MAWPHPTAMPARSPPSRWIPAVPAHFPGHRRVVYSAGARNPAQAGWPSLPWRDTRQAQTALPQSHTLQKKRWPGGNTREGNEAPALYLKRRGQKQLVDHTAQELERRRTKVITKASSKQSPERDELSKAKSNSPAARQNMMLPWGAPQSHLPPGQTLWLTSDHNCEYIWN